MSMSSNIKPWLWELLDWNCSINQGRTAYIPAQNLLVSSFKVVSETNRIHQIKTISTGFQAQISDDDEEVVVKVVAKRKLGDTTEYRTKFANGQLEWLLSSAFISDDGTVNSTWLSFVDKSDIEEAFSQFTQAQLKVSFSFSTRF